MPRKHNIVGQTFGRLTVLAETIGGGRVECVCSCGTRKTVASANLRDGRTRSCGCLNRELASDRKRTHGMTDTPEYATWSRMINRCENEASDDFAAYGARGITVCARWRESFEAFFADMGRRPSARHSIDRVDNSRGYGPDNCRWATATEQARNTRTCRMITVDGVTKTMSEWAADAGVTPACIFYRLKRGLPPSEAVAPRAKSARKESAKEVRTL